MTMFAVADEAGAIVNRIVVDDVSQWDCPAGLTLVSGDFEIGGSLAHGVYSPPAQAVVQEISVALSRSFHPEKLMAQFTVEDAAKIQAAVSANPQFWLLWCALQAQSEPMAITSLRFLAGWSALVTVLGQVRMDQIAVALGAKSLVA